MFELMLRITVRYVGEFMPEAWADLLALAPNPEVIRAGSVGWLSSHQPFSTDWKNWMTG